MIMYGCPHCDYETDTENGLNIHIGRKHGKPTKKCEECGKEFETSPSLNEKYCDDECYRKNRQEKSQVKTTECNYCGDEFSYHPKETEGKFCSRECYDIGYSRPTGKDNPLYKEREVAECVNCGEEFEYRESQRYNPMFCSQECLYTREDDDWEKPGRPTVDKKKFECYTCGDIVKRLECDVPNPDRVFCSHSCRGKWVAESDVFRTTGTVYVKETGREVRSGWEASIDRLLYKNDLDYTYEQRTFEIGERHYIPDFIIRDEYVIEVKGQVTDKDIERSELFMENHSQYTYIVVGSKLPCDIHIDWDNRERILEVVEE